MVLFRGGRNYHQQLFKADQATRHDPRSLASRFCCLEAVKTSTYLLAGLAHQRLGRMAREEGMDLDVSALPRMPSGRINRDAADALFDTVREELESDPDNWRRWYRLARAYDYAGDRSRAREAMKKAVQMEAS